MEVSITTYSMDEWLQKEDKLQKYTVKFGKLNKGTIREDVKSYDMLWKLNVFTSAKHFTWKVMHNKIPTKGNFFHNGQTCRK